jgi:hypothetical protein
VVEIEVVIAAAADLLSAVADPVVATSAVATEAETVEVIAVEIPAKADFADETANYTKK